MSSKIPVFLPFDAPVYEPINSNHPLVSCLCENRGRFQFERVRSEVISSTTEERIQACYRFVREVVAYLRVNKLNPDNNSKLVDEVFSFASSRGLSSQYFPTEPMLSFHHTAPMHLNQSHHILHLETIQQLFYPYYGQGERLQGPLIHQSWYWIVRYMLESDKCVSIFSNLNSTLEQLVQVFDSDVIAKKLAYVAPGPHFTKGQAFAIESRFMAKRRSPEDKDLKILFTNSWHDHEHNFYLRGGHFLLEAFRRVSMTHDNIKLVVRSSIPSNLPTRLRDILVRHPSVTLMQERVSEDKIIDLFAECDVTYLCSASFHSVALMRAMHAGHCCILSDANGYSEMASDGVEAIVVKGVKTEEIDEGSGFRYDEYESFLSVESFEKHSEAMARILIALAECPNIAREIGANARKKAVVSYNFINYVQSFDDILEKAFRAIGRAG